MCRRLICSSCLVLALALFLASAADAADLSLVGWWKLDEGSGKIAYDSSTYGNNGTVVGNPAWVPGYLAGALQLDGIDDYIDCGNAASLNLTQAITLSAWVRTNDCGRSARRTYIRKGGPSYTLNHENNNTIDLEIRGDQGWKNAAFPVDSSFNGVWHHLAGTFDGSELRLYIDGNLKATTPYVGPISTCTYNVNIGRNSKDTAAERYDGLIDDVRIYNRALRESEIHQIMVPAQASNPHPADGATDVPRATALRWTPGPYADKHDIYFGTTFDNVNNATTADPHGVYLGRQSETTCMPDRLELGQTYYWRVDEVNSAASATIVKGDVWTFQVEPRAYPVATANITVSASSSNSGGEGPENTINGSGLNAAALHSVDNGAMWVSSITGPQPTWIQYEFDRLYKLDQMWVWNYNGTSEPVIGYGIKEATIEYSVDGINWAVLGASHELARGPAMAGYAHNTTVDLGGIAAKHVRLTVHSNWGGIFQQYGLSEVRFFSVPVAAREPQPASGTMGVDVDATLSWRAGREAAQHQILLGTDPNSLAPAATTQTPAYVPAMNLGTTYYWRVDEVNAAETPAAWPGAVWSFSTREYLVVDDFESYGDKEGEAIFQTWSDGLENPANGGSQVGNDPPPYAERTIVHAGEQSMPLFYDNTSATNSEAVRTLASPQDWTRHGIKGLTLRFYGDPANAAQQMYVKINSTKIPYDGDAADLQRAGWKMWYIDLTARNVGSVTKLSIGFDRLGGVGGQGRVFIDDLRLYPRDRSLITPVDPGTAGLQAQYQFEGNFNDSSGKGRKGSAVGSPLFVPSKLGQAVSLDGYDDYVNIDGYKGILADVAGVQQAFTISAWIKTATDGRDVIAWGTNAAGQRMNFRVDTVLRVEFNAGNIRGTNGPSLLDDEWHHVAATVPQAGRMMDVLLYVDGVDVTPASTTTAPFNLTAGTDVAIGMGGPMATDRFFNGLIDEVRFYDRVLSAGEIAALARRTMPLDKPF